MHALVPHAEGAELMGRVPDGVEIDVWSGPDDGDPASAGEIEFFVPPFLSPSTILDLVSRLPALRVVQTLSAGVDAFVGRLPQGITLCDARGVHDLSTAEWVVTAMLAALHEFPRFAVAQAKRQWDYGWTDVLGGKTVLIVGYGSIGAAVERRLAGFEVSVLKVARSGRDGVLAVDKLPELLPRADVVVVLVPMTSHTRGMVDAEFLAGMRDGALLVNAARGPVVDSSALLAELSAGRLCAALDVTDPEPLPPDHPLWDAPGLLLTPHVAGSTTAMMPRAYALVRDQLERYVSGAPLENVVEDEY